MYVLYIRLRKLFSIRLHVFYFIFLSSAVSEYTAQHTHPQHSSACMVETGKLWIDYNARPKHDGIAKGDITSACVQVRHWKK